MTQLSIQPTPLAQWYSLVNEAQSYCQLELGEDLESYLVFLLMRFTTDTGMAEGTLALDFLESLHTEGRRGDAQLKNVGERCLLYAGLFPERARRKNLHSNYFVNLGQSAYYALSLQSEQESAQLYHLISSQFVSLRDVLKAIRHQASADLTSVTKH